MWFCRNTRCESRSTFLLTMMGNYTFLCFTLGGFVCPFLLLCFGCAHLTPVIEFKVVLIVGFFISLPLALPPPPLSLSPALPPSPGFVCCVVPCHCGCVGLRVACTLLSRVLCTAYYPRAPTRTPHPGPILFTRSAPNSDQHWVAFVV